MTYAGTITLMAVAMLLAGACAGPSRGPATPAPPAELTAALAGLCRAEDLARAGDLSEARTTFEDRAHGYLHELAAGAQGRARAPVGRLLEAKNRVELALQTERGGTPAEVAADLTKLETATRDVAAALGTPAPRCGGAHG
jgi:hypothetical protein